MVHWCISQSMNHKPLELVLIFIHFILFSKRLMYMYIQFKELQIFLEKSILFLWLYSSVRARFSFISTKKTPKPQRQKGIFQSSFLRNYSCFSKYNLKLLYIIHWVNVAVLLWFFPRKAVDLANLHSVLRSTSASKNKSKNQ